MVLCRNWSQHGSCRFGDNCRFEHSQRGAPSQNTQIGNRFGSLQNNTPPRNNNYSNQNALLTPDLPYTLDKAAILIDLTLEAPQWILSAYGPGRNAPTQLFGGAREQSPEEMRLLHYVAMAAGNPQQAAQEADMLFQTAQQQMQAAANNVDGAVQFIINGENEHPNRIDIVNQTAPHGGTPNPFARNASPLPPVPAANPFGASSQPSAPSGAFGQPSGLGARPSPFGSPAPAFGAPTQPSPFGQPSGLGGDVFGQPSPSNNAAPFGQPSGVQAASPFGQPSNLGQTPNLFGASSNTPPKAPFPAFSNTPAPFQQPQAPSAFGNNIQPMQPTPFGKSSTFGAQPVQAPNPFNTVSSTQFGSPSPAPQNPFGGPSQSQPPANPFGAGNSVQTPSPFDQAPAVSTAPNPFGVQSTNIVHAPSPFLQTQQAAPMLFSNPQANAPVATGSVVQPIQPIVTGSLSSFRSGSNTAQQIGDAFAITPGGRDLDVPHPDISTYSRSDHNGRLASFKGQRVVYQEDKPGYKRLDGKWQKIMFPNGPPPLNRDTALSPENYVGNDALKAAYQCSAQQGVFKDGKIPLIPPLQQWCSFDF